MRAIIIEDEPLSVAELRTTLAEVAPQIEVVATASSVAEAAAVIAGVGHDLIFMDIHLGDGSGFDIFQRTEISVPVIFITAYDSYALKAFENKGIDYLLKPFGREDLQRAIDKLGLLGGVGMGVTRPGTICSTIGTSGVVFGCSAAPFIDPEPHGMYSQCHAVPGQYSFLGCTLGAGGSFKWMRDTFFAQQKEALAARGESIYDYMTGLAAEQQPGCGGLVFLPYLGGEGTPYVDPNARGVFFGLSYQSDLGALCRAVMEGVTFSLRDTVEIIRAAGVEISQIRVAGGGAKSALWRQMQTDIFGQSVCMTNVDEAPAAGAAILAGVAAGLFPSADQACQAMVQLVSTTEPIAAHTAVYNEYYQTYRGLYQSLRQDFARQAELAARADAALSGISHS